MRRCAIVLEHITVTLVHREEAESSMTGSAIISAFHEVFASDANLPKSIF
jgi:hypothetical protein